MIALKSEFITRRKPVNGFTGVAALMEYDGHQICFVSADAETLLSALRDFMPNADQSEIKIQNVTIIQAQ